MKVRFMEGAGNFKVYAKLNGIERLTKRAVRRGMFRWAKDLKQVANRDILDKSKKTGRIYLSRTRGGRRRRHQASAPFETHANFSGALRRSLSWKVQASDRLEFGYNADGKGAPEYAEFIEFGTFKMKKRPSVANAIDGTLGTAEVYFEEELGKLK